MVDVHVHLRDFEEADKEDWQTGTAAALAGGVIGVLDMPNNHPPIIDSQTLSAKRGRARNSALCDYGFYLGATAENFSSAPEVAEVVFGLKMYLNITHGPLLIENQEVIRGHFEAWPNKKPILVHAEGDAFRVVLSLLRENPRPVHFCHLSQEKEIEQIREAKEERLPVTCEVTPHHLFLTDEDERALGPFGRMKPPLRGAKDVDALWRNLEVVDVVASDHAPHTKGEKLSAIPPFGVPGLETTLPLLLTAVSEGRLTLERVVELTSINPARIFGIQAMAESYIEADISREWTIEESSLRTKSGWSPFSGAKVTARIHRVILRGRKVFEDGEVLAKPGFGREFSP